MEGGEWRGVNGVGELWMVNERGVNRKEVNGRG